ncbi:MAG: hypothetical protein ACXABY_37235, partial [Candidatus Thorarchaeota archaeon]
MGISKWLITLPNKKSQAGQVQILAAAIFLLLIPSTIIVAQNATQNITGELAANLSDENQTTIDTLSVDISHDLENSTVNTDYNQTEPSLQNLSETNHTHFRNETMVENQSIQIATNTSSQQPPSGPDLTVELKLPERTNRNEGFAASALITNSGDRDAADVEIEWNLPDGIKVLEGSPKKKTGIKYGSSYTSRLVLSAHPFSDLGIQEIKVLVR